MKDVVDVVGQFIIVTYSAMFLSLPVVVFCAAVKYIFN